MRIDAQASPELKAALVAIRSLDRTLRKVIRQQTKRVAGPEWKKALAERAATRIEQRVLVDTAVVTPSDQNVRIQSASKGRPLSGGLNPKTDYPAAEFGTKPAKRQYMRKGHKVTRTTGTAFRRRNSNGNVFYPAAREMIPRLARLWVQTTVRTIGNALEGKAE